MRSSSRRGLLSDSNTAGPSTGSSSSSSRKIKKQRHRHDESMSQLGEHSQTQTQQRYPPSDSLPDYESPAFPLDAEARKALAELSANHDTRGFKRQMDSSYKQLSDSISSLNDALSTRRKRLREMQAKRQRYHENGDDDDGGDGEGGGVGSNAKTPAERAEEKAVHFLKEEVPDLSEQIEAAVREVIDMQAMLEDGKEALHDAARQAETESAAVAQKQRERAVARQARQDAREAAREERAHAGEDGEDEDEEEQDDEEDEDMQDEITGPLMMLQEAKHRMASDYQGKSMYARYGVNNDYIAFKKLWHDATHGLEDKPLPDATRWFAENGTQNDGDEDDDDDLVIDTETHALECPLSRQIMRDPYTCRTCKHTFDKESIKSFLAGTGRRPSDEPKQCPQLGCSEMVRFADFYPDQIMLRRIKRAQEQDADMLDEDEGGYEDEPTMASVKMTQQRAIKTERGQRRGRRTEDIEDDEEDEE